MAEFNPNPTMGENAWTMATSESNKVSLQNKDGNVHRFALSAIREELLEREGEKERKRKREQQMI